MSPTASHPPALKKGWGFWLKKGSLKNRIWAGFWLMSPPKTPGSFKRIPGPFHTAKIQPKSCQDPAKIQSKSCENPAKILSKPCQNPDKTLPTSNGRGVDLRAKNPEKRPENFKNRALRFGILGFLKVPPPFQGVL